MWREFVAAERIAISVLAAILLATVLLLCASFAIDPRDTGLEVLEPTARILAHAIPAVDRLPARLTEIGQGDVAAGARHMLVLGWLYLGFVLACGAISSLAICRSNRSDFIFGGSRSQHRKTIALSLVLVLMASWLVFFGYAGSRGLQGGRAPHGLPVLAIFFAVAGLALMAPAMACGAMLQHRRFRREGEEEKLAAPQRLAALRVVWRRHRDKAKTNGL